MKRAAYVLVAGALLAGLVATCAPPTPEVPEQVSPVSPMSTPTETPRPTTAGTSPTETRTPTEAPTPTRTPEPTPTPLPTATVEAEVAMEAPNIEGTRKTIEETELGTIVAYRAEENNPYGLEAGAFVGYFYPEAYILDPETNFETEQQIGAVGLRPEVVKVLLQKAGYPNEIVFPIPFDISYAENPEELIKIMEIVKLKTSQFPEHDDLFFSLPKGSKLVNPFPTEEGKIFIRISPQFLGHVLITYAPGGVFEGGYPFFLELPKGNINSGNQFDALYGETILDFSLPNAFPAKYRNFVNDIIRPNISPDVNVRIMIQTLVVPMKYADLAIKNILQIDGSPVFILANDNPLLTSR